MNKIALTALALLASPVMSQTLLTGPYSIDGKLCVGTDCTGAEAFDDLTGIKIKQSAPGILFDDTGPIDHPDRDWAIEIGTGVAFSSEYFGVRDVSADRLPFQITGDAPENALFVADDGHVGLGTSLPLQELHIVKSGGSAVRLEDTDGSPFIWDVLGNDFGVQFFDRTNNRIPFLVRGGAPSESLVVAVGGDVGISTETPASALHVVRSDGTARIFVEETGGSGAQELFKMSSNGGSYFTLANTTSGRDWFFTHENNIGGRFIITSSTNPSQGMFLSPNGNLQIGGTLTENSDKHAKMAIEPVDAAAILDKVAALPVSTWSYKDDSSGARHLGPMAQDFHAAFGLGETETGISTLDTSGVALAAIQALASENHMLKDQTKALQSHVEMLTERLAVLEQQIEN